MYILHKLQRGKAETKRIAGKKTKNRLKIWYKLNQYFEVVR